jgi:hypothetical protein
MDKTLHKIMMALAIYIGILICLSGFISFSPGFLELAASMVFGYMLVISILEIVVYAIQYFRAKKIRQKIDNINIAKRYFAGLGK